MSFRRDGSAGIWNALILTLLVSLSACGGGGGGGDSGSAPQAAPQAPVASFTVSNSEGFAPLTVTFDGRASHDPDGSITAYRWTFGDDAESTTGPTVTHTFEDTGLFTVTLQVTDDDGLSASTSRSVRARGATVSGIISIPGGSAVDSDVNDRLTTPVSNDSFGAAQPVPNPLRLGGFVNVAGSGAEDGNFTISGDPEDFFFVELSGDERIVLSIGDPSADLDLELYNDASPPELVDASVSPDPDNDFAEDIVAPPEAGGYFVRVVARSGASNYVLSISSEADPAGLQRPADLLRRAKRLTDPFVVDELLMADHAGGPFRRYRVERDPAPAPGRGHYRVRAADPRPAAEDMRVTEVPVAPGSAISADLAARYRTLIAARDANRSASAGRAEVNVLRQPLRVPNDPFYELQWHYPAIELEQAWDLTVGADPGSPPVVVAVVDTGVLLDHPDLRNQILRDDSGQVVGFDFIQDPARANDGDGIDPNPDDPGDDARGPGRGGFHGTHVAGIIAADSNNGIGVAGVSWGARIMPLRALGIDGGTTFDVMQAVRYAAGLSNISGTTPVQTAHIINMSLGSDFYSEAEQATLNEVRARGVFVVASAGNGNSDVPSYPAAYDGVLSVSATTITGARAPYSNFGPSIDLAAPGGDARFDLDGNGHPDGVVSSLGQQNDDTIDFVYAILQGTSMAAPHVSGVIALMKAIYPQLTPEDFDALLQAGALTDDAGAPGRDDAFGWGIINARKAVEAALAGSGGTVSPALSVSSGTLNFQSFTRTLEFSIGLLGDEPAVVTVSADAPWLTISQTAPNADGLGQYQATVDRAGLPADGYTATISITTDNPDIADRTIGVLMNVAAVDVDADAGQHYVVLVAPDGNESLAAQIVNAVDGEYTFALRDVPPGEYRLFAGTDLDNDGFICDGGESCGAFPSLSSPAIISIDARQQEQLEGLSFFSEFRTTATTTPGAAASADTDPSSAAGGIRVTRPAAAGHDRPTMEFEHEIP